MGLLSKFFDRFDSVAYFLLLSSAVRFALAWVGGKRLVGRVSRLVLYPVKSMAGIDVESFDCCTPGANMGRFGDRHFVVVRGDKNPALTARVAPTMLLIKTHIDDGKLRLSAESMDPLVVDLDEVEALNKVDNGTVHDAPVVGLDCGEKAAAWLDHFLKKPGHRLFFASPLVEKRSIKNGNIKYTAWTADVDINDKMAYHDSSTYHILSEASVDDLNSRIDRNKTSVSSDNFRPNILVSGASAYAEDSWVKVYIGEAEFSPVKLCGRCVLTTIDPKSAKKSNEPLVTLRSYRKIVPSFEDSPCLGVNLILDKPGAIRVGDAIYAVVGQPKLVP